MNDPAPSPIGPRDVIAAWAVCLGIAAAVLLLPVLAAGIGQSTVAAQTAARTQVCAVGDLPVRIPHG